MAKKLLFSLFFLGFAIDLFGQTYPVGRRMFTFSDAARSNRSVTGEVFYPGTSAGSNVAVANGNFPVIVFGHGFGMAYTEYEPWWLDLVPKGYILVFPNTEAAVIPFPNHEAFAQDMSFLLNRYMITENANSSSAFYQKVGKGAFMGHSMGGGCSYRAASINTNETTTISLAAANINTSPNSIQSANGLANCVLTIAGSRDCVVQSGGSPIDMYNGLTSTPYKAYILITNGSHCQFGKASAGSICTLGESCSGFVAKATQHAEMLGVSNPWLDYFLKGQCNRWADYKAFLQITGLHTFQESGALPAPPSPTIVATPSNASFCPGGYVQLSATLTPSAIAPYCNNEWRNGSTVVATNTPTYQATSAGTYTCVAINPENLSATSTSIVVTAHPSPNASIVSNGVLCPNGSISLDAGAGFSSYLWSNGQTSRTLSASTPGNYSVVVSNSFGCTSTASTSVSQQAVNAPVIAAPAGLCPNTSAVLSSSGFSSYIWSNGGNSSSNSITTPGIYSLIVSDNNGCTSSASVNVAAFAAPNLTISGSSTICQGGSTLLDAGTHSTYRWSNGTQNQSIVVSFPGSYSVTVTNPNGCAAATTFSVSQSGQLSPSIAGDFQICQGNTGILNAGSGYTTYLWSNGATTAQTTVANGGVFQVTVTDGSGCSGTASSSVIELLNPNPVINGILTYCRGNSTTLQANQSFSSYLWSNGSTSQSVNASSPGFLGLTVSNAVGCTATTSTTLFEIIPDEAAIYGDLGICQGSSSVLSLSLPFGAYLWSNGSTTSSISVGAGDFSVTTTDTNGCQDIDSVTTFLFPPSLFTISGNGNLLTGTSGFSNYQWYLNGNPLSGANGVSHLGVVDGTYTLGATDLNGCSVISNPIALVNTSTMEVESGFRIFPNPASDWINVIFESETEVFNVNIYDCLGQCIGIFPQMTSHQIPIKDLPNGVYSLVLSVESTTFTQLFIKH